MVDRTLSSRRPVDQLLRRAEKDLSPSDRGLLRELVLGTLRWLRRLDSVIETASSRQIEAIDPPIRSPLRLAIYQLLFLDRVPAHAAVDEAVTEVRRRSHRGGAGFANAILRRVAKAPRLDAWPVLEEDPIRRLAVESSHPDLLVDRWWRIFGEQRTRDLVVANNRIKPLQILTFRDKGGRDAAAASLAAEGVETVPSDVAPMGLVSTAGSPLASQAFASGSIYLQDVASQAAALVPPPAESERVLDLAAAPGGKSFSLLSWEPGVRIWAADSSWRRLLTLRQNRDRLALPVGLLQADALQPPLGPSFDRVILDLPCTGTGTLRKNPELKWRISAEELDRLAGQGLEMLRSGARLVRPGGILAMVTCSIEPEENAEVVSRFLTTNSGFELMPLAQALPPDLGQWAIESGGWQIPPEDVHDGFTVHVVRRRV